MKVCSNSIQPGSIPKCPFDIKKVHIDERISNENDPIHHAYRCDLSKCAGTAIHGSAVGVRKTSLPTVGITLGSALSPKVNNGDRVPTISLDCFIKGDIFSREN